MPSTCYRTLVIGGAGRNGAARASQQLPPKLRQEGQQEGDGSHRQAGQGHQ